MQEWAAVTEELGCRFKFFILQALYFKSIQAWQWNLIVSKLYRYIFLITPEHLNPWSNTTIDISMPCFFHHSDFAEYLCWKFGCVCVSDFWQECILNLHLKSNSYGRDLFFPKYIINHHKLTFFQKSKRWIKNKA